MELKSMELKNMEFGCYCEKCAILMQNLGQCEECKELYHVSCLKECPIATKNDSDNVRKLCKECIEGEYEIQCNNRLCDEELCMCNLNECFSCDKVFCNFCTVYCKFCKKNYCRKCFGFQYCNTCEKLRE